MSVPGYRRARSVLSRAFADEVILASPHRDGFDLLSGTASAVWEILDRERSLDEIVEVLARDYGASPESILPDVRGLLDDLAGRGWIEPEAGAGELPGKE